jgi:hypothetical protein
MEAPNVQGLYEYLLWRETRKAKKMKAEKK